ncbi:hypothetical protein D1BOALGB6SA_10851 [Olavius sp. associated proteobacterium Delta 1]|nr:hypothetical protein D1BOALGB6SA_10851 [Olavius sp. associated proteobacterium Delta 1]
MATYDILPDTDINGSGVVSKEFLRLGVRGFINACRYVHQLPYGYNSDRDDLLILFKEGRGSCTTKHAVIATLAEELSLPIVKNLGIYRMTENIVTGTKYILGKFNLPYVPMVHCFLVFEDYRVDLTEGNDNGKKRPVEQFLHTETVIPNISAKDEYLLYRNALKDRIVLREELRGAGVGIKRILQAREQGIKLLRSKV